MKNSPVEIVSVFLKKVPLHALPNPMLRDAASYAVAQTRLDGIERIVYYSAFPKDGVSLHRSQNHRASA